MASHWLPASSRPGYLCGLGQAALPFSNGEGEAVLGVGAHADEFVDVVVHFALESCEASDELELVAGAFEVVVRAFGTEVGVAEDVVGEETEGDLVGEEFSRKREVGGLAGGEDADHFLEETAGERPEYGHADLNRREVGAVFLDGGNAGADEIAEVVEAETGHHGVEVDDADTLAGMVVDENVGEFGVVVGDAFRDETAGVQAEQVVGDRFVSEGELDLVVGLAPEHKQIVLALIRERDAAKAEKNFAKADELRDGLAVAGIKLIDQKDGTEFVREPNFDPAKLEALK